MKQLIVGVFMLAFVAALVWGLGSALAWLFAAAFGVVKPWYVYSVAGLFIGLLASVIRGGK